MHEEDSGSDSDDLPTVRAKRRALSPPPAPPPPPVSQDQKVVWPPVVIIENTQTHFDREKRIWKGLENEEIRCFLKGIKDLHFGRVMALYGPKGNKGKSIVIFPATPLGFMDAQGLCQCLERDHRGRHDWIANRASQRHLITNDGKKVLYGYLASESDMQNVDPYRKIVKRWSMESYVQKVIVPMKQIDVEWQEAKKRRLEMDEEKSRKMLAVEQNKSEFGKAAAEFKKINEEVLNHKRQEEELQAKHRKDFEERKRLHEKEKLLKIDEFRNREVKIRELLNQNKITKEKEMAEYKKATQHLMNEIDEERKKHKIRIAEQKQYEVMERMKLDSMLQAKMEERLARFEKKFQDKQLQLQEQHNQEIKKCREAIAEEREKLCENNKKQLEVIEKEVIDAKNTSQRIQDKTQECVICMYEFGKELKERALFQSCCHANVCLGCAEKIWKQAALAEKRPECPTCKTEQEEKWTDIPARIYS